MYIFLLELVMNVCGVDVIEYNAIINDAISRAYVSTNFEEVEEYYRKCIGDDYEFQEIKSRHFVSP